eukprot:g1015.t1
MSGIQTTHISSFDFEAQGDGEMSLKAGEKLEVLPHEDDRDGWVLATKVKEPNETGYVPFEYLEQYMTSSPVLSNDTSRVEESRITKDITSSTPDKENQGMSSEVRKIEKGASDSSAPSMQSQGGEKSITLSDASTTSSSQQSRAKDKPVTLDDIMNTIKSDPIDFSLMEALPGMKGTLSKTKVESALVDVTSMSVAASCRDYNKMKDMFDNLVRAIHIEREERENQVHSKLNKVSEKMLECASRTTNVANRLEELQLLMENELVKWKEKLRMEKKEVDDVKNQADSDAVGTGRDYNEDQGNQNKKKQN